MVEEGAEAPSCYSAAYSAVCQRKHLAAFVVTDGDGVFGVAGACFNRGEDDFGQAEREDIGDYFACGDCTFANVSRPTGVELVDITRVVAVLDFGGRRTEHAYDLHSALAHGELRDVRGGWPSRLHDGRAGGCGQHQDASQS